MISPSTFSTILWISISPKMKTLHASGTLFFTQSLYEDKPVYGLDARNCGFTCNIFSHFWNKCPSNFHHSLQHPNQSWYFKNRVQQGVMSVKLQRLQNETVSVKPFFYELFILFHFVTPILLHHPHIKRRPGTEVKKGKWQRINRRYTSCNSPVAFNSNALKLSTY